MSARGAVLVLIVSLFAPPASAGMEDAVKALQSGDVATAEKELQVLAKERDPRAVCGRCFHISLWHRVPQF